MTTFIVTWGLCVKNKNNNQENSFHSICLFTHKYVQETREKKFRTKFLQLKNHNKVTRIRLYFFFVNCKNKIRNNEKHG